MRKLLLASVFAAALPLVAHAADIAPVEYSWIEDNAPAGHRAMVSFSLAATYFDMDATNGFSSGIFSAPDSSGEFVSQADDGLSFATWGITGDIEAWIPTNASHYFIGGLEGAWVERDQSSELTTDQSFVAIGINGQFSYSPAGAGPFEFSSSGEFYRVAGLAGIGTDVSDQTRVGVGAYVAYSELDMDALFSTPEGAIGLDETVETWSAGLAVLGESRQQLMPGVSVFFKGRAAALYANGALSANQVFPFIANPVSVDDRQEEFAGLVEGRAGFEVAIGPNATVSIFGGAAWRNDVFEIVNPRAGPGDNNSIEFFSPAHLAQTDLIEYSAGGKIEINY